LLAGRNDWEYFVPPVFDAQQPDGYFKTKEREISLTTHLSPLLSKKMSQELQLWLFHQYQLLNAHGETKDLVDI
jgi:tRNA pseudouridine32 synthase/23S rRNA pseudouridine746 synthase